MCSPPGYLRGKKELSKCTAMCDQSILIHCTTQTAQQNMPMKTLRGKDSAPTKAYDSLVAISFNGCERCI